MKNARQSEILRIVQAKDIDTQDQLLGELKARGFTTTQATISRDIKQLHLVKELTAGGIYKYAVSQRKVAAGFAGKLRTIFKVLLPQAAGGIFSGILLASGRIAGESAALIYTAGTLAKPAFDLMSPGATLSVHMYKLLNEGLYMPQASAVAVVLLVLCIIMNLGQMLICKKMTKGSIA